MLKSIEFGYFGVILKQSGLLPTAINAIPDDVKIFIAKDNAPRVKLKFSSKTTDLFMVLYIRNYSVSIAVNNEVDFLYNEDISREYRTYAENIMWRYENNRTFWFK